MSLKRKKILIWIGAELAHYFLAYSLQKKIDADFYAIIDITNKPKEFFEKQNLVGFKKIWFFHDEINPSSNSKIDYEFLKSFEEKYQLNFWKYIINERIFYGFYNFHKFDSDEILSLEQKMFKFFEKVLEESQPDFFLTKVPSFHHLEIFKDICIKKSVKVLMLNYAKLSSKMFISENIHEIDYIQELDFDKKQNRTINDMKNYLKKNSPTIQLKHFHKKNSEKKIFVQFSAVLKYIFTKNTTIRTNYNYYGRTKSKVLFSVLVSIIKKRIRKKFMDKNLLIQSNEDIPYVYFPLSVDLERHVLIDAPFFTNQLEVIRHIVKSLPIGFQLYIKENPSMVTREWRSISEIKDIMKIPNVKFFHPNASNEKLLENSKMVISIGGSSALEAVFYQKPSIVFGNVYYKLLPSVKKVERLDELHNLIKNGLNENVDLVHLDSFLSILDENLFDFNMVEFGRKISDEFYQKATNVDIKINETQIEKFIQENISDLDILAYEHLKKIEQHEKN